MWMLYREPHWYYFKPMGLFLYTLKGGDSMRHFDDVFMDRIRMKISIECIKYKTGGQGNEFN
jgi:hypothetical protein